MSSTLIVMLVIAYLVLAVVTASETQNPMRWPMCLYWIGSATLTIGVLWMSTGAPWGIVK